MQTSKTASITPTGSYKRKTQKHKDRYDAPTSVNNKFGFKDFTLSDSQKKCLTVIENNIITFVQGRAGCVDADTEFFSQNGWKKIKDYVENDLVGQFDKDTNEVSLVKPLEYIKKPCEEFTQLESKGLHFCLSPEHRVIYWENNEAKVISYEEFINVHNKLANGFKGKFKTTFNYLEGSGLDYTEGELRLQIAVMADGRIVKEGKNNYTQMRFSKERKYLRLLELCKKFNLPFKDNGFKENTKYSSNKEYEVIVWPKYDHKFFNSEYYKANSDQLKIIFDEVFYWDGSIVNDNNSFRYFTTKKENADFIQFVAAANNYCTSIVFDNRVKKESYTVNVNSLNKNGFRSFESDSKHKSQPIKIKSTDGFKYCFSVPKTFLLMRKNNKIFITGNTGKTMIALHYAVQQYLKEYSQRIIVIRTPVEANSTDKIGYLPSELKDKIEPHFVSAKTILEDLLNKDKVDADLNGPYKRIQFLIPNFALGVTWDNATIIMDECFTPDHEFLTPNGWKFVNEILDTDLLYQYNTDGSGEFVRPLRLISKEYKGNIVTYSRAGVNYSVTENHRLVYRDKNNQLNIKLAKDTSGSNSNFIRSTTNDNPEYNISDDMIKLSVALQADGSCTLSKNKTLTTNWQIQISKKAKIERFTNLSNSTKLFHQVKNNKEKNRWYEGNFYSPILSNTPEKLFNFMELQKFSLRQKQLFIEELKYWDGHIYNKNTDSFIYCSTSKHNIDVCQSIAHLSGYTANISTILDKRKDSYKTQYKLSIRKVIYTTTQNHDKNKKFKNYEGKVYCATVPSGMLLTRKQGAVHVSGNCQMMQPLIMKLLLERIGVNSKVIVLGDPSQLYNADAKRQGMADAIQKFFIKEEDKHVAKYPDIGYFEFSIDDCMRSDIVKTVLEAYS